MASKQNLDHLVLSWGMPNTYSEGVRSNGSEAVVVDLEVLDALKPCNMLKVLQIKEYRGDKFPVWMTEYQMLENLVELYIIECRRCTNVPPLHRLPLLQILKIDCMDNLKHLCCGAFMSVECGEDAQITFPALKSFFLREMLNLDCWCEGDVGEKTSLVFPVLCELSIINCPKLGAMPVTPLLEELTIEKNETLASLATGITNVHRLTLEGRGETENNKDENGTLSFKSWESPSVKPWESLQKLTIKNFNHIIPPTNRRDGEELGVDVNSIALRQLKISSSNFWFSPIPSNSPLWLWKCFTFLESLDITECDSLTFWPEEEFSNLIYLRNMVVSYCKNFIGSRSESLLEKSTREALLPKLKYLEFSQCPNMVEVPQLPKYLEILIINGSTKLECLPEWSGSSVDLKQLYIGSCQSFNSFPSSIRCLIALEGLSINDCINLESLPDGMQGLEALKSLHISGCPKIRILPEGLLQRLRSLDRLWIFNCPLLQRDFQKHGKYWHLISEIPNLGIQEGGQSSKKGDLTRLISSCKIPCLSAQS